MQLPQPPTFRLDKKRALVVGSSSGIGLGCAVALADAGAHVTLAARRTDPLEANVAAFHQKGWSADYVGLNIAKTAEIENIFTHAPPYDIVVNSAGTARHSKAVAVEEHDFEAVMAVNVKGAFFLSQQAAKSMIANKVAGSIIHISSQMAKVGGIDRSAYCASKHALDGFIKAMAIEWGEHQIRINSICPTFILTALTQKTFDDPDRLAWIKSKIKLGRVGKVEDIMGATVFLASDAASLITGTALLIDGGWTAG